MSISWLRQSLIVDFVLISANKRHLAWGVRRHEVLLSQVKRGNMSEFVKNGFAIHRKLLDGEMLDNCRKWYAEAFKNKEAAQNHRHDLGGHVSTSAVENVSQLMWPSLYIPDLSRVIDKCVVVARQLLGDDMDFDFDMMISKNANVETPWHQGTFVYFKLGYTGSTIHYSVFAAQIRTVP